MPTKHTTKITPKSSIHKKTNGHHETRKHARTTNGKLNGFFDSDNKDTKKAFSALAVGLAGLASFLFLKPKKSKRKSNLYNSYQNLRDDAGEFAHNTYDRGRKVYDYASDYAENMKDTAHDMMDHPYSNSLLLAGAIGGTILGASAFYLINHRSSKNSSSLVNKAIHVFDTVRDATHSVGDNLQGTDWLGKAKDLVDLVIDKVNDFKEEEFESDRNHHRPSHVNDAFTLALNGFRLWQNMSNKKR